MVPVIPPQLFYVSKVFPKKQSESTIGLKDRVFLLRQDSSKFPLGEGKYNPDTQ